MKYTDAKKLHNNDKVTIKKTNEVLTVCGISSPRPMNMINRKNILIECSDGNIYHHADVNKINEEEMEYE